MASELQSLDTIFNSRVFRIPDYQRGYAWESRQLIDFWQDLDGLADRRNHYTGQLTLERVPEESWKGWDEDTWLITGKNYKPFYVVDGQQRLTTAIILIKCLLERVPDNGQVAFTDKSDHTKKYLVQKSEVSRSYLFGYEKDNPSYEYLKTKVLGEPSNQFQGIETTYTANLQNAQDFFREKVKGASQDQIECWFKALTQRFLFNVYELQEELDVFVVFETMNNRGKPLSRLELLKNRLIYLSTLIPGGEADQRALRRNVNDAWKTVYEFLGREKDQTLGDDDFLQAHWIMYFTYARDEAGQFASFLLDDHFTTERVISGKLSLVELQRYVTSVQESARKWHAIHFPDRSATLGEEVRRGLERLNRLGLGAFKPLVMAGMHKSVTDEKLTALLDASERFVFVVGRLSQRRANTGDSEFYRLAGQIYRNDKTVEEATEIVHNRGSYYFSAEKATTDMRDLFQRAEGFYSWQGLRYFLFEYEQYLKTQAGLQTPKIHWDEFTSSKRDHETIEHIYPQSPIVGEWPTFEARGTTERAILLNSLGNLLALSQSRNSKFSNRAFAKKKQDQDGIRGYFNGSYSEIAVAQFPDWTPESVLERGLEMLTFLESRWDVSLGSREEKLKLLNLDFRQVVVTGTVAGS
jgi:uncharacterized protein with ParB-like and HNH nuclease domain